MVRISTALGFALATVSVLIPGVLSQEIPACAIICAEQAAGISSCSVYVEFLRKSSSVLEFFFTFNLDFFFSRSDTACICGSQAFATAAGQCLSTTCDAADVQAAESYFLSLCSGAFVRPLFHRAVSKLLRNIGASSPPSTSTVSGE